MDFWFYIAVLFWALGAEGFILMAYHDYSKEGMGTNVGFWESVSFIIWPVFILVVLWISITDRLTRDRDYV